MVMPIARARWSVPPPGANGTTMRIGLSGKAASAGSGAAAAMRNGMAALASRRNNPVWNGCMLCLLEQVGRRGHQTSGTGRVSLLETA
ncbi:hypothetical protein D9M68_831680 [compost metagenome]